MRLITARIATGSLLYLATFVVVNVSLEYSFPFTPFSELLYKVFCKLLRIVANTQVAKILWQN